MFAITRPASDSRPVVESLPPRILYSADPVQALVAPTLAAPVSVMHVPSHAAAASSVQAEATHELAVVDLRVPDSDRLIADLREQQAKGRSIDIVTIDGEQDPLASIDTQLARSTQPYTAVHLVSHGEPGVMILGGLRLDADALLAHADRFANWSTALASGADLMIYGCDLAGNDAGKSLLHGLATLTGADVAASTDATGHAALGGDWDLEFRTGTIEAPGAFGAATQHQWQALLAIEVSTTQIGGVGVAALEAVNAGRNVATNSHGDSIVAWRDDSGTLILGMVIAADGTVKVPMMAVNAPMQEVGLPVVSMAEDGSFVVGWWGKASNEGHVYLATFDAQGHRLSPLNQRVPTGTAHEQFAFSVAYGANGKIAAAWINEAPDGAFTVRARMFDANGTAQSGGSTTISTTGAKHQAPSLAWIGGNKLIVVWQADYTIGTLIPINQTAIVGRLIDQNGFPIDAEFSVSRVQFGNQLTPEVAATSSGFAVVWTSKAFVGGSNNVAMRMFDQDGVATTPEIMVASTTASEMQPSIHASNGNYRVVYQASTSGNGWDIFTRTYSLQGVPLESGPGLINTARTGDQFVPTVSRSTGMAIYTYYSNDLFVIHQIRDTDLLSPTPTLPPDPTEPTDPTVPTTPTEPPAPPDPDPPAAPPDPVDPPTPVDPPKPVDPATPVDPPTPVEPPRPVDPPTLPVVPAVPAPTTPAVAPKTESPPTTVAVLAPVFVPVPAAPSASSSSSTSSTQTTNSRSDDSNSSSTSRATESSSQSSAQAAIGVPAGPTTTPTANAAQQAGGLSVSAAPDAASAAPPPADSQRNRLVEGLQSAPVALTVDPRALPIDAQASRQPGSAEGLASQGYPGVMPAMTAAAAQTLRESLGSIERELAKTLNTNPQVVGASVVASASMSIGYVIWLVRGGALLTSLLASMPAWSSIDPLPVLDSADRPIGGNDGDDDDDSLAALVARGAKRLTSAALVEAASGSPAIATPTSTPAPSANRSPS